MSGVAVLGAGGLLGRHVVARLAARGVPVASFDRAACDVTDRDAVARALHGAEAVVNCAAYTNVDRAEAEPDLAHRANALGAEHVGSVARATGVRLAIHVSTDFVFDGTKATPYEETDPPNPLSVYARTKLEGERRFLDALPDGVVVRVQGLYGAGGANFASKLPELLRAGKALRLDAERRVQPTWAGAAAAQLVAFLDEGERPSGLFHLSCTGATTWAGFTERLVERLGIDARFERVPTAALTAPAARPPSCLFAHAALRRSGRFVLPSWEAAQDDFLRASVVSR